MNNYSLRINNADRIYIENEEVLDIQYSILCRIERDEKNDEGFEEVIEYQGRVNFPLSTEVGLIKEEMNRILIQYLEEKRMAEELKDQNAAQEKITKTIQELTSLKINL